MCVCVRDACVWVRSQAKAHVCSAHTVRQSNCTQQSQVICIPLPLWVVSYVHDHCLWRCQHIETLGSSMARPTLSSRLTQKNCPRTFGVQSKYIFRFMQHHQEHRQPNATQNTRQNTVPEKISTYFFQFIFRCECVCARFFSFQGKVRFMVRYVMAPFCSSHFSSACVCASQCELRNDSTIGFIKILGAAFTLRWLWVQDWCAGK